MHPGGGEGARLQIYKIGGGAPSVKKPALENEGGKIIPREGKAVVIIVPKQRKKFAEII